MDAFTSLLEGRKRSFPWKTDSDTRQRGCIVKLMVRQIGDSLAEHWALYFDWTDRAATYEANDDDGYLIPTWNRGYPDVSYTWKMTRRFSLECSPQQVNSSARQLSLNGQTYLLTDRNCHHWAIALADAIGLDIDGALETYLPSDLREIMNFGYSINNLTNFSSLLHGSTRAANSGYSRTMALGSSKISRRGGTLTSASRVASRGSDDEKSSRSYEQDSTPTLRAVGGAVVFATYAIGALLRNFTGDGEEETPNRDQRYN
ncbi:hypothetical protein FHG87_015182, partial [Trinorchestia longiramus]